MLKNNNKKLKKENKKSELDVESEIRFTESNFDKIYTQSNVNTHKSIISKILILIFILICVITCAYTSNIFHVNNFISKMTSLIFYFGSMFLMGYVISLTYEFFLDIRILNNYLNKKQKDGVLIQSLLSYENFKFKARKSAINSIIVAILVLWILNINIMLLHFLMYSLLFLSLFIFASVLKFNKINKKITYLKKYN